jgi:dolichol-phosphate hexosyltransferase
MKKISVVIPCHNEEKSIGKVIQSFDHDALARAGYILEILVVDNASTDKTAVVARSYGATVIQENRPGKGYALRKGFQSIARDADYVVNLDGDNTYKGYEILRLIEPLAVNFCDVVIGSRLSGKIVHQSMPPLNRLFNWGFSFIVRHFYQVNVTDVLTGYFAFQRKSLTKVLPHLTATDFRIEMEMVTKLSRLHQSIYSVPITYDLRIGNSKLKPWRDGSKVLLVFFQNFYWKPPK